jgi:omega-amidase
MEVALVQCSLHWENPELNRAHLDKVFRTLSSGLDVIVLPEMFTTGFTMEPANISLSEGQLTLSWMREWSGKLNAAIVGSLIWQEGADFRNRLVFMKPDGSHHTYDKRHTFTLAGEDKVYTRGSESIRVHFRGITFCPLICYDLRFPVWSRYHEPYDVLLYVANWPEPRISAWDVLLRARAIENMAYVVGVNRVGYDSNGHKYPGHSAVYDVLGKRLGYSEIEEVLYIQLDPAHIIDTRSKLRFLNDRDSFSLEL